VCIPPDNCGWIAKHVPAVKLTVTLCTLYVQVLSFFKKNELHTEDIVT